MSQLKILKPLEEFLKHNRRSTEFLGAAAGIIISVVIGTGFLYYSAYLDRQVAIRSHNLDVFYRSLTCGDLPLGSDTNESACEEAIGKFMLKETGLFTR